MSNVRTRQTEVNTLSLENSRVRIRVGKKKPVISEFFYKPTESKLLGSVYDEEPSLMIFKDADPVHSDHIDLDYEVKFHENSVNYHVLATCGKDEATEFDIFFKLTDKGLSIKFDNVIEYGDFHLISIHMPNLISVKNENGAKLVIPSDGGRLVDVATASCKGMAFSLNRVTPLLVELVYNNKVIGILETASLDNRMRNSVYEYDGVRYASLSLDFIHRLFMSGGLWCRGVGYSIPARDPKYHLLVQESSEALISLIGDYDHDGTVSWVDAAKYIRDKIPASINPLYKDKIAYHMFLDAPGLKDFITFDEALELIKKIAYLTDFAPQIIYLIGWQYYGHDTGYPAVDKVNERLGGYEGLIKLIEEAKKYNAIVSFHDNYDDAYMSSPKWDPEIICRDSEGNLKKGGVWHGGRSYIINSYKYVKKDGLQRVRDTLKRYPISVSCYVDVLSAVPRRYDFNPESPTNSKKILIGKIAIIKEFNRHGIDVVSEGLTAPFIGHISHFLSLLVRDEVYYNYEEQIPFTPFIYHDKASYNTGIHSEKDIIKALIYGSSFYYGVRKNTDLRHFTDAYYLVALPSMKLYGKKMQSYIKKGKIVKVIYEDGSYVEANFDARKYVVNVGGIVISKDFTCFVPMKDDLYLGYSKDGGLFDYPIPTTWRERRKIRVLKLSADGKIEEVDCKLEDGALRFFAEPHTPYKITLQDKSES